MKRPDGDDLVLIVLRLQQTLMTALVWDHPTEKRMFSRGQLIAAIGGAVEVEQLSSAEDQLMSAMEAATLSTLART